MQCVVIVVVVVLLVASVLASVRWLLYTDFSNRTQITPLGIHLHYVSN